MISDFMLTMWSMLISHDGYRIQIQVTKVKRQNISHSAIVPLQVRSVIYQKWTIIAQNLLKTQPFGAMPCDNSFWIKLVALSSTIIMRCVAYLDRFSEFPSISSFWARGILGNFIKMLKRRFYFFKPQNKLLEVVIKAIERIQLRFQKLGLTFETDNN